MTVHYSIESSVQTVEHRHHLESIAFMADRCKTDDIAKIYGDAVIFARDDFLQRQHAYKSSQQHNRSFGFTRLDFSISATGFGNI